MKNPDKIYIVKDCQAIDEVYLKVKPQKFEIRSELKESEGYTTLKVKDTGEGFDVKSLTKAFPEPTYQKISLDYAEAYDLYVFLTHFFTSNNQTCDFIEIVNKEAKFVL